jgi:hypothetical protein
LKSNRALQLAICVAFGAALASADNISFTCDPSVSAATCNYLNTKVAGEYTSTFSNLNANIYITYGTTALASSTTGADNQVTYSQYATALAAAAAASGNTVQIDAVAALTNYDASVYRSGNVDITSALANALGISGEVQGGNTGITGPGGSWCSNPGSGDCYNGVITVTNDPTVPLYYDNLGGTEASDQLDFYNTVEHEVDQLLGTASCISTQGASLANDCPGNNTPSAADLFRYSGPAALILDSSLSTTPGAYFSYNGGVTNGATTGVGVKFYNTLDNGDDYGDFVTNCAGGAGSFSVQDAEGCPGTDAGLTILNDGGAEINMLNAVGYELYPSTSSVPEPRTLYILVPVLLLVAYFARRRIAHYPRSAASC